MARESKEQYEFGEFRLDVSERKLERVNGRGNGSLAEKPFQTLVHLVRNAGALVSKEELLSTIWKDTIVEENNVGKAIHAIRHCLGDRSDGQKYIETIPKHGYRLVAEVKRVGRDEQSTVDTVHKFVQESAPKTPARSPAWDLYLRGKVKAGSETRADAEAAIKVLQAAVEIDPELAGAYAQLARAYNTLAFKFSSAATAKRLLEDAEVAILKALTLDPELAEGHFARGLILWTKRKGFPHEQAIISYKRALELDPHDDETHHQLSMVYSHIGLLDEAQASVARALDLNPNNTMARFRAGVYSAYQGRFDDAMTIFKTIPRDVSPMLIDRSMAEVYVQTGRVAEAETIVGHYLKEFPQDEGGSFTGVKALLLAKAGRFAEAEDAIADAVEIGKSYGHFHHTAHNIAGAYAAMEKPAAGIKWLEAAADDGFPNLPYFEIDPNLQNLNGDPGFQNLLSRLRPQWLRFKELAIS